MLEVKILSKSFGKRNILNRVSLGLETGKIYSLIGPNGSGKTTLLNIINGFLKADAGSINLEEQDISNHSPVVRNQLGIGRTFQDLRLITNLTVKENILLAIKDNPGENLFKAMMPKSFLNKYYREAEAKAEKVLQQVYLTDVAQQKAGEISYGQQKLLTIGCCIANDAKLLLLDEPVAGINPEYRQKIKHLLIELKGQGKTIFLIEHNSDFIEEVSDKLFFLNDGKMLEFDTYPHLKSNTLVQEAYL